MAAPHPLQEPHEVAAPRPLQEPHEVAAPSPRRALGIVLFLVGSQDWWLRNPDLRNSGEVLVLHALKQALSEISGDVAVAEAHTKDELWGFLCSATYNIVLTDPDKAVFDKILENPCFVSKKAVLLVADFFGTSPAHADSRIGAARYATMYPQKDNLFLGYAVDATSVATQRLGDGTHCILWGKAAHYFKPEVLAMLRQIKAPGNGLLTFHFQASIPQPLSAQTGVTFSRAGVLPKDEWHKFLSTCHCVIGLGDPLVGPTAFEAMGHGALYVNPRFAKERDINGAMYTSQHPYLENIKGDGSAYVCNYLYADAPSLQHCINHASTLSLPPFVPEEYRRTALRDRLEKYLNKF